jgi:hypothetical protein
MDTPRPKKEREQFGKETRDLKSKMDREVLTDSKGWLKDNERYGYMKYLDDQASRSTKKKPAARSGRKTAARKRGR